MRNHFLPSRHTKSALDDVPDAMIHVGEWSCEHIICFLDVLKCDFGEVN
jgi:hypothetical protein